MQINTNPVRIPLVGAAKVDTPRTLPHPEDKKEFGATESLDASLRTTPEVRHSEIERATRLVQNEGYPPPELIRRLSRLLADEINSNGS